MLGPDDSVTRRLSCGDAAKLLKCSPLAVRCYLSLFWGEDSERAGLARCRPGAVADLLGSSKRATIAALDELQSIGLIRWSADEGLAIRDGFALANWPKDWPNARAWAHTIMRLRDGVIASELRDSLGDRIEAALQATSKATSGVTYQAASEAIVRQSVSPSVRQSNSTPLPTVAAPTGATAPVKERKERAPRATFAEPTEQETLALVEALVPTLQPFRQERIAAACYSYWQSAGWKRKSGLIKDWPATVRTWVTNQADRDKDVSVALVARPIKSAAPLPSKAFPFYASNGKGLNAPEFIHPTLGPTEMTREEFDADQAKLPVYMRAPTC
jgi:hypothetical protein